MARSRLELAGPGVSSSLRVVVAATTWLRCAQR